MKGLTQSFFIGIAALALGGCSMRLVDFTALSSKNCDIQGSRGERTKGEDMTWFILGFPIGIPNMKEATDRAIERCGGDLLVDGVVYQKGWSVLLVGQSGFTIEGTCGN